ncbi:hypothetical protein L915_08152 [Phytophthora nicotianae]|uniref:Glutamate synthase alpha subunit C-terminal domain-containing protein n=1 Tax=Phytophthora nicotianae TaxID=4792 RepID=W2GYP2_PHYNI|nr:hypothetical protein L915_08152 [Phytophthora nicotianae]
MSTADYGLWGDVVHREVDSTDYLGKAVSGGEVSVFLCEDFSSRANLGYMIVGNGVLYGGKSGEAYLSGNS